MNFNENENNDIIVIPNYVINNVDLDIEQTDIKKTTWKKKENLYCNNCGKHGHIYKKCYEPILSYGIICLNLNDQTIDNFCISKYKFPNNVQQLKNICTIKYIQKNISCNNKKDLDIYEDKISNTIDILMVRRKHTYNYIYLIRGMYSIEIESIIKSINLLTRIEYENLLTKDFDELWEEVFNSLNTNTNEYKKGKEHFNLLIKYIIPQIKHRINIIYDNPEWGFPKGKRNNNESNLECAKREFQEETGLIEENYTLLDRLFPLIEIIKGSDGINYKHVYYMAIFNNNIDKNSIRLSNISNNYEIGDIKLFSIEKSLNIIRDYNLERIELLNNLKLFLIYNIRYLEKFYHEKT